MYKPVFSLSDSEFGADIVRRLYYRSSSEILISAVLYVNVVTVLAVILSANGLSVHGVVQYVIVSYGFIFVGVFAEWLSKQKSVFSGFPDFFEALSILSILVVNHYSYSKAPPVVVVCGIFFAVLLTLPVSIRSFSLFLFGKFVVVFSCFVYVFVFIEEYQQYVGLMFVLIFLSVLFLVVAYWLHIKQITLLHQNFEVGKLKDTLKKEHELREKIIRHIGHDLRQPISTINFSLYNVDKCSLSAGQYEHIEIAQKSVDSANYLIEDILQVSSYGKSNIAPNTEGFQVQELFDLLEREFRAVAQSQGIRLFVMPCSLSVRSDFRLVSRIVRNFLSNAIRYSNSHKIVIGARRRSRSVDIQIIDQGIGISEEDQKRIFSEFFSGRNAAESAGFGLGLSIAKNLADACEAKVFVDSEEGRGTTCTLRIKLP